MKIECYVLQHLLKLIQILISKCFKEQTSWVSNTAYTINLKACFNASFDGGGGVKSGEVPTRNLNNERFGGVLVAASVMMGSG